MDKRDPRQMIKLRTLKLIHQDGIALTEVSRSSGIPIATLVYWQSQAEQNSEEPS